MLRWLISNNMSGLRFSKIFVALWSVTPFALLFYLPAHGERFGIITDIGNSDGGDGTQGNGVQLQGVSHIYDSRQWLGQPMSLGKQMMAFGRTRRKNFDLAGDLLLVSKSSCITARYAAAIQRPVIMVPADAPAEGCFHLDDVLNQTDTNSTVENSTAIPLAPQIIPLYLYGYKPVELLSGLVRTAFQMENVLLVHVCDDHSYCGREGLQEAVQQIHDSSLTTIQCWMTVMNDTDFMEKLTACMKPLTLISNLDRKIVIILNTRMRLIPSSIEILNAHQMLSISTKVIYIVPPNYHISDLDFLQMKVRDDVSVVRWQGEAWLASITQRTVTRYSQFWGASPSLNLNSVMAGLDGILTTVSASQYYSRMMTVSDPHQVMPAGMCAASGISDQLRTISADLSRTLSCEEKVGLDVCSSYTVIKYDIDPVDDTPRPQTSASWSTRKGYHSFKLQYDENLHGRKLRIGVISSPPFLRLNDSAYTSSENGNDTNGLYEGVVPSMLKTLSGILNFSYELVIAPDGDNYYGSKGLDGMWNGMIGMLQRKEIDFIAADLTVSGERQEILDYTVPFYEDSITVLLPRSQFEKSFFTFLYPFDTIVWCCVIAAVALSGPLLYFFSRSSPYYQSEKKPNYFASLSESYMYCYGAIVSQGGQVTPDADSSRIFMVFWWLFGICTVATYSGNLIAFLTFPGKLKFVDNFDDFVYTSNIQPVVERNGYTESLLRTSNKQTYLDAWNKIKKNEHLALADYYKDATDKVVKYKFGFIGALANMKATIVDDSAEAGPCKYALMRKPLEKVNYAFAFRKGTNYVTLFNKWIRRMSYSGLIDHWTTEELDRNHKPKTCQEELEHAPDEVRKVGIVDVVGLYICLGVGCAFACLIFLLERLTVHSGRLGRRLQTFFDQRDAAKTATRSFTLNNGAVFRPQ